MITVYTKNPISSVLTMECRKCVGGGGWVGGGDHIPPPPLTLAGVCRISYWCMWHISKLIVSQLLHVITLLTVKVVGLQASFQEAVLSSCTSSSLLFKHKFQYYHHRYQHHFLFLITSMFITMIRTSSSISLSFSSP